MIIVIADDFSGAAEIAGIGKACGMDTLLVNTLPVKEHPDLLVIDSATRSLSEDEAFQKVSWLCQKIDELEDRPYRLFKKVDSILRGHIRAELRAIEQHFGYTRTLLLPANPSRYRTIQNGYLKISDRLLHQTPLSNDPEFPRVSSHIYELLHQDGDSGLHHHLPSKVQISDRPGLYTADISTRSDLEFFLKESNEEMLLGGGAEFFETFLISKGNARINYPFYAHFQGKNLFINGSTYLQQTFTELFSDIPVTYLKAFGTSHFFDAPVQEQIEGVHLDLITRRTAMLALAPAPHIRVGEPYRALLFLAEFVRRVIEKQGKENLNLFITGGSTASCLFQHMAIRSFVIKIELSEGVVVLQPTDYPYLSVVVKPGSYAWPRTLKLSLTEQEL